MKLLTNLFRLLRPQPPTQPPTQQKLSMDELDAFFALSDEQFLTMANSHLPRETLEGMREYMLAKPAKDQDDDVILKSLNNLLM